MENELDKIFKDGLENRVEPTFESDWLTFDKLLKPKPFYKSGGFLGMIALLIISLVGYSVFTLSAEETAAYYSRSNKEIVPASNLASEGSKGTITTFETDREQVPGANEVNSAQYHNNHETGDSQSEQAVLLSEQNEKELEGPDNASIQYASEEPTPTNTRLNPTTASRSSSAEVRVLSSGNSKDRIDNSPTSQQEADVDRPDKTDGGESPVLDNTESIPNFEGIMAKSGGNSNLAATGDSDNSNSISSDSNQDKQVLAFTDSEKDETPMVLQYEASSINTLGAIINTETLDYNVLGNAEKMEFPKPKTFDYALFFGLEQNTILKTSPSFGFAVRKHFNKWTAEAGIAYQQSGKLSWSQQSEAISYGFDRYENAIQLRTNKIDLLSLPLKLSYRIGGQSQVFAGFTPSVLINSQQEKLVFNDGTIMPGSSETGYLYSTNAPDLIYFMSAGYTYSLSEQFQFDFGLNYSLQEWNTSEKQSFGGFVKFYYTFR